MAKGDGAKGDGDETTGKSPLRPGTAADLSDAALWRRVTETIKPLKSRRRPAAKPKQPSASPPADPIAAKPRAPVRQPSAAKPLLPELAPGVGIDKRTAQRLARGQLAIEARLDLHGLTQSEAHARLAGFIRRAAASGKRSVLVITGKGTKPGGETGVLRQAVPRWLNEPALRRDIVALRPAQPKDGGAGALYVLLRRDRGDAPAIKDAPPPKRLTRRRGRS
jgi:DNA-nicking Smr family endonuclease